MWKIVRGYCRRQSLFNWSSCQAVCHHSTKHFLSIQLLRNSHAHWPNEKLLANINQTELTYTIIKVTTAQKYQRKKGHMISHQTHFNTRLHHWYYLQPSQSLHQFHFKELYIIISLRNHFSNACSSLFMTSNSNVRRQDKSFRQKSCWRHHGLRGGYVFHFKIIS